MYLLLVGEHVEDCSSPAFTGSRNQHVCDGITITRGYHRKTSSVNSRILLIPVWNKFLKLNVSGLLRLSLRPFFRRN